MIKVINEQGSNGKFFFTSEDSTRWQQENYEVKKIELKNAELVSAEITCVLFFGSRTTHLN